MLDFRDFETGVGALVDHRLAVIDFSHGPTDNPAELSRRLGVVRRLGEVAELVQLVNSGGYSAMDAEAARRVEDARAAVDSIGEFHA